MNKTWNFMATGLGIWVSGIIVGANAADLWPGKAFLPAEMMLGVGLVASIGNLVVLFRAIRKPA